MLFGYILVYKHLLASVIDKYWSLYFRLLQYQNMFRFQITLKDLITRENKTKQINMLISTDKVSVRVRV